GRAYTITRAGAARKGFGSANNLPPWGKHPPEKAQFLRYLVTVRHATGKPLAVLNIRRQRLELDSFAGST
ncbi:MAG TPA: hypothetical protein VGY58_06715, partial [Gemmataceae bacterium]|nr:hypothetical protein [Gemmataceae bacterium]